MNSNHKKLLLASNPLLHGIPLAIPNTQRRPTFLEFIKYEMPSTMRNRFLALLEIENFYHSSGVFVYSRDQRNPSHYRSSPVNTYRLHLMHLALIDGRPFTPSCTVSAKSFHRTNYLFLRALLSNNCSLVKFFLQSGFPRNINGRIFGDENHRVPTYLMLAVSLNNPVMLALFADANPRCMWLGISPAILSACNTMYSRVCRAETPLTFVTATQMSALFGKSRPSRDVPIFPLDFLCMRGDPEAVAFCLKQSARTAPLSEICFLVQMNPRIHYMLLNAGACCNQELNGLTPMHLAALVGCLESLQVFVRVGAKAHVYDKKGRRPLEYATARDCIAYLEQREQVEKGGEEMMVSSNDGYRMIMPSGFVVDRAVKKYEGEGLMKFLSSLMTIFDNVNASLSRLSKLKVPEFVDFEPQAGSKILKKYLGYRPDL